jgi:hypothetical protein
MTERYEIGLALSALLALGCGGNAVDLGASSGSGWTDATTSPSDATTPQTIYDSAEPIYGFALEGPTLYALIDHRRTIELVTCPLARCRSERTTLFSRAKADNEGTEATSLILADGLLYWVDTLNQPRRVVACPTTGCSATQVLTSNWDRGLAADDDGVYWFDFERKLMRGATSAAAPSVVRDMREGAQTLSNLALHGDHIYFLGSDPDSSSVRRVRKDGTTDPEPVAADQNVSGFSLTTDTVYYLSQILTGRVATCSLEDCATGTSTLAANQRWPGAIRVEGNEVFWLNNTDWRYDNSKATLVSCLLPDCSPTQTRFVELSMARNVDQNQVFAVNQDSIVWLEAAHGFGTRLRRLAR